MDANTKLVERLRRNAAESGDFEICPVLVEEAATEIEALQARLALLEALTKKLLGYAGHDDGCQIMTHGVWSDPTPCTCGYSDVARAALKEPSNGG